MNRIFTHSGRIGGHLKYTRRLGRRPSRRSTTGRKKISSLAADVHIYNRLIPIHFDFSSDVRISSGTALILLSPIVVSGAAYGYRAVL
ncbi:hypothetical protein L1987_79114 [Smallanthus sonchifolius]|uniref:Uncharacterized protein n=1 Tax=Smallanthus sonchifolius TaxID=185202 RepID=A0ACB8ZFK8_9ASTR|nr:hypothetical protein L1987_79114 [Smallanthus sonchifolius]